MVNLYLFFVVLFQTLDFGVDICFMFYNWTHVIRELTTKLDNSLSKADVVVGSCILYLS